MNTDRPRNLGPVEPDPMKARERNNRVHLIAVYESGGVIVTRIPPVSEPCVIDNRIRELAADAPFQHCQPLVAMIVTNRDGGDSVEVFAVDEIAVFFKRDGQEEETEL